jgi:hypothetical protein
VKIELKNEHHISFLKKDVMIVQNYKIPHVIHLTN